MRKTFSTKAGGNQPRSSWLSVRPHSRQQHPSSHSRPGSRSRLSVQLDIPTRLAAIRAEALRNLAPSAEAFAQRNFAIGRNLYLRVSILTDHAHWRGGWIFFRCPAGEEKSSSNTSHSP